MNDYTHSLKELVLVLGVEGGDDLDSLLRISHGELGKEGAEEKKTIQSTSNAFVSQVFCEL